MITQSMAKSESSSMDIDVTLPSDLANKAKHQPSTEKMQDSDIEAILKGGMLVKTYDGTSQYTQHGISACGLASFNAVRCILLRELEGVREIELLRAMMTHELVQDVTSICTSWTSSAHLEVEEIHDLPLFSRFLKIAATLYGQPSYQWFIQCLEKLEDMRKEGSNAIIFTKPPEILCLLRIDTSGIPYTREVWVVFDSHSRPPLHPNGAAFSFFGTMRGAAEYLAELLQADTTLSLDPEMQWQAQLLSQCSAHIITAKNVNSLNPQAISAIYGASVTLLQAKSELADLQMAYNNLQEANTELARKTKRLEDSNSRLTRELTESRESVNSLLQQQQSKEFEKNEWTTVGGDKGKGKEREYDHHPEPNHKHHPSESGNKGSLVGRIATAVADYVLNPTPSEAYANDSHGYSHGHNYSHSSSDRPQSSRHHSSYDSKDRDKHHKLKKSDHPSKRDREAAARLQDQKDHEYAMRLQQELLAQERRDAEFAASLQRDYDEERIRLMDDVAVVQTFGFQETFDCSICMDTHPEDSVAKIDPCTHKFCRPCIKSYVVSKIQEKAYPILCPLCITGPQDNTGLISPEFIEILGVSQDIYVKYNQLQLSKFSILLECRKCGKSVNVDKEDHKAATIITCPMPRCRGMWCRECSQFVEDADGADHSCDGTKELDRLLASQNWKRCPGCTTPVEKIDGCNHMACEVRTCHTHFCWIDGAKITQGPNPKRTKEAVAEHYSRHCKGQLFDVPAET